ncbi:uncharacterized protein MONOS_5177 [Monocercomonoides exilis]|uniref:uncharacterized protein n=1 Tax=Monocercomonoides exilis TaxID=2049356 RepID=UPI003559A1EE|nr:hypothetical protein MONOS_5177 [Monocercomonoides exilis]|eukprot:MONOS_5177.1-p1 / transcript=MONOS_5177.1 / gene=MONOS_5177 / organism=Monocercomonoides_exilis_PA203 / gene_product=unspecified product / transcript_product=unspecified product / location=Mono_scaffold00148:11236-18091(-) / protein_length=2217 / sequence_SO=supercontig / SO=protein_coding / is_pseudo=false
MFIPQWKQLRILWEEIPNVRSDPFIEQIRVPEALKHDIPSEEEILLYEFQFRAKKRLAMNNFKNIQNEGNKNECAFEPSNGASNGAFPSLVQTSFGKEIEDDAFSHLTYEKLTKRKLISMLKAEEEEENKFDFEGYEEDEDGGESCACTENDSEKEEEESSEKGIGAQNSPFFLQDNPSKITINAELTSFSDSKKVENGEMEKTEIEFQGRYRVMSNIRSSMAMNESSEADESASLRDYFFNSSADSSKKDSPGSEDFRRICSQHSNFHGHETSEGFHYFKNYSSGSESNSDTVGDLESSSNSQDSETDSLRAYFSQTSGNTELKLEKPGSNEEEQFEEWLALKKEKQALKEAEKEKENLEKLLAEDSSSDGQSEGGMLFESESDENSNRALFDSESRDEITFDSQHGEVKHGNFAFDMKNAFVDEADTSNSFHSQTNPTHSIDSPHHFTDCSLSTDSTPEGSHLISRIFSQDISPSKADTVSSSRTLPTFTSDSMGSTISSSFPDEPVSPPLHPSLVLHSPHQSSSSPCLTPKSSHFLQTDSCDETNQIKEKSHNLLLPGSRHLIPHKHLLHRRTHSNCHAHAMTNKSVRGKSELSSDCKRDKLANFENSPVKQFDYGIRLNSSQLRETNDFKDVSSPDGSPEKLLPLPKIGSSKRIKQRKKRDGLKKKGEKKFEETRQENRETTQANAEFNDIPCSPFSEQYQFDDTLSVHSYHSLNSNVADRLSSESEGGFYSDYDFEDDDDAFTQLILRRRNKKESRGQAQFDRNVVHERWLNDDSFGYLRLEDAKKKRIEEDFEEEEELLDEVNESGEMEGNSNDIEVADKPSPEIILIDEEENEEDGAEKDVFGYEDNTDDEMKEVSDESDCKPFFAERGSFNENDIKQNDPSDCEKHDEPIEQKEGLSTKGQRKESEEGISTESAKKLASSNENSNSASDFENEAETENADDNIIEGLEDEKEYVYISDEAKELDRSYDSKVKAAKEGEQNIKGEKEEYKHFRFFSFDEYLKTAKDSSNQTKADNSKQSSDNFISNENDEDIIDLTTQNYCNDRQQSSKEQKDPEDHEIHIITKGARILMNKKQKYLSEEEDEQADSKDIDKTSELSNEFEDVFEDPEVRLRRILPEMDNDVFEDVCGDGADGDDELIELEVFGGYSDASEANGSDAHCVDADNGEVAIKENFEGKEGIIDFSLIDGVSDKLKVKDSCCDVDDKNDDLMEHPMNKEGFFNSCHESNQMTHSDSTDDIHIKEKLITSATIEPPSCQQMIPPSPSLFGAFDRKEEECQIEEDDTEDDGCEEVMNFEDGENEENEELNKKVDTKQNAEEETTSSNLGTNCQNSECQSISSSSTDRKAEKHVLTPPMPEYETFRSEPCTLPSISKMSEEQKLEMLQKELQSLNEKKKQLFMQNEEQAIPEENESEKQHKTSDERTFSDMFVSLYHPIAYCVRCKPNEVDLPFPKRILKLTSSSSTSSSSSHSQSSHSFSAPSTPMPLLFSSLKPFPSNAHLPSSESLDLSIQHCNEGKGSFFFSNHHSLTSSPFPSGSSTPLSSASEPAASVSLVTPPEILLESVQATVSPLAASEIATPQNQELSSDSQQLNFLDKPKDLLLNSDSSSEDMKESRNEPVNLASHQSTSPLRNILSLDSKQNFDTCVNHSLSAPQSSFNLANVPTNAEHQYSSVTSLSHASELKTSETVNNPANKPFEIKDIFISQQFADRLRDIIISHGDIKPQFLNLKKFTVSYSSPLKNEELQNQHHKVTFNMNHILLDEIAIPQVDSDFSLTDDENDRMKEIFSSSNDHLQIVKEIDGSSETDANNLKDKCSSSICSEEELEGQTASDQSSRNDEDFSSIEICSKSEEVSILDEIHSQLEIPIHSQDAFSDNRILRRPHNANLVSQKQQRRFHLPQPPAPLSLTFTFSLQSPSGMPSSASFTTTPLSPMYPPSPPPNTPLTPYQHQLFYTHHTLTASLTPSLTPTSTDRISSQFPVMNELNQGRRQHSPFQLPAPFRYGRSPISISADITPVSSPTVLSPFYLPPSSLTSTPFSSPIHSPTQQFSRPFPSSSHSLLPSALSTSLSNANALCAFPSAPSSASSTSIFPSSPLGSARLLTNGGSIFSYSSMLSPASIVSSLESAERLFPATPSSLPMTPSTASASTTGLTAFTEQKIIHSEQREIENTNSQENDHEKQINSSEIENRGDIKTENKNNQIVAEYHKFAKLMF